MNNKWNEMIGSGEPQTVRTVKAYIYFCSALFVMWFCAASSTVSAQPAWSRGEQKLAISYDECMRRAGSSLTSEGYIISKQGGAYIGGQKDLHTAVIMCNLAFDQNIWVNIVVASNHRDENVSGAERVRLQGRMGQASSGGCGLGKRWRVISDGGWSGLWTRRGNSNVFDADWSKDGQRFSALLHIYMEGGRVKVHRRNATLGGDCELNGTLASDGLTVTGTNVCAHGQGDVQLKIECE